jgi:heat shock protein HslJ
VDRRRPSRRARAAVLPVVILAIAAAACGASGTGSGTGLGAAVGEWRLVEGTAPSGPLDPVLPSAPVTLVIGVDPEATDGGVLVGGSSGCNQYGTRFVPSGGATVEVADVASTLMACADPDVTALEAGFLEGLALVATVEADGDRLVLAGPRVELRFARTPAAG